MHLEIITRFAFFYSEVFLRVSDSLVVLQIWPLKNIQSLLNYINCEISKISNYCHLSFGSIKMHRDFLEPGWWPLESTFYCKPRNSGQDLNKKSTKQGQKEGKKLTLIKGLRWANLHYIRSKEKQQRQTLLFQKQMISDKHSFRAQTFELN